MAVTQMVRAEVARVLSLPSFAQVAADKPLQELGLDSLMAVELKNSLSQRAGATLSATLAFDHPTPQAIAKYLLSDVLRLAEPSRAQPAAAVVVAADEAIAIVGIGCRFPGGVTDPESFWRLLDQGIDAITEVPRDRWDIDEWYDPDPDALGKMTTRWGGFLPDLERFEPSFFGISPREAVSVDPQERLLLETTWEAIEHAGIRPDTLMGSRTGVYMGLCGTEYQNRVMADARAIDAYAMLGTAHSTIVGRLSYWLGLKGPNMPIDTACSSSLVAVHLACQALRNGECDLAFAGGANVILSPEGTVYFSRLRAMSPTGRCHTFSADADGYVRSEGAGVVLLERLSDALERGRRVLAIIRGSAVNQDGRSNGLTAPNGPSQQAVIQEALRRAGIAPSRVGYVECHGTGTPLGDPIEVQALAAALGGGRSADQPLRIGALKSNIGHTEGAAGVGGLIKATLALQHGRIPKSLHFTRPNPHIAWHELPVQVASEPLDWVRDGAARVAGVSSFGISGTNAHVVLEEAPSPESSLPETARSAELVVLSAKTPAGLAAAAGKLCEHLEAHPELALGDVAHSLVATRSLHEQRLVLPVESRAALIELLRAAAAGETPPGAQRGAVAAAPGKMAWLFTGQGAQRRGMGRELSAEWPVFRAALDAVCALFDPLLELPLREVMWAEPSSPRAALLDQTGFTQPALFAFEWALAALWRSWGIEPELLLGHSIGEITAAAVAGVFTLEDAVTLVAARARLMQALPPGGAMVSLGTTEARAREELARFAATVSLAAVNGPTSVVVAGKETDIASIAERFRTDGVQVTRLSVSHAFHSPLMEPLLEAFREVAESIRYLPPRLPLVSDLTGVLAGSEVARAQYWVRHVRDTIQFARGVQTLAQMGADTFLELGPKPTLLGLVASNLPQEQPTLLASLRPGRSEPRALFEALGSWCVRGGKIDWSAVSARGGQTVPLPSYPWQRERYWVETRASVAASTQAASSRNHSFYRVEWRPAELLAAKVALAGRWVVVSAGALRPPSELTSELQVRGASAEHVGIEQLAHVEADHVLCVWDGAADADVALRAATCGLSIVQSLSANSKPPRLWWVTRQAIGVDPRDDVQPAAAAVWGLGRTVMQEHPELHCTLLDVDSQLSLGDIIQRELAATDGEDQIAWRSGQRRVIRLAKSLPAEAPPNARPRTLRLDGTVLVTGGLGALGLVVAASLAQTGVKHLLLLARRGKEAPEAMAAIERLEALGARVTVASADVSDAEALARALANIPKEYPLRAVVHLAGVVDDAMLSEQTAERFAHVLSPKVRGAWNLHQLTRHADLDAFVLFSSMAGTLGSAGQSNYAAANAYLDALAAHRRVLGLQATSLAWGPWSGSGMAAALDAKLQARFARQGIHLISPGQGAGLFRSALQHTEPQLLIASIDLTTFAEVWGAAVPPIWRGLLPAVARGERNSWRDDVLSKPASHRLEAVTQTLREEVARVLSFPSADSAPLNGSLRDLGLDSLMAMELRSSLGRRTGLLLPTTLAFDQATLGTLAELLLLQLGSDPALAAERVATGSDPSTASPGVAHCERLSRLATGSRLICFPDAGGVGSMFLPLVALRDAGVEIHVISHNRLAPGDAPRRARAYSRVAADYVRSLSERPYALYGHSVGALLAWHVAQELIQSGGPRPLFLAPSAILPLVPGQRSAADLSEAMRLLFGARPAASPGSLSSFEADFAADMALWQALPATSGKPLPVPISAFVGVDDNLVTPAGMQSWAEHTDSDFSLIVLPGDHFYPYRNALRSLLVKELAREFFDARFGRSAEGSAVRVRQRREVSMLP
jgi:epothilone polyketide synthase D